MVRYKLKYKMKKMLAGMVFGKWTVLKRTKTGKHGAPYWLCRCSCGAEKDIASTTLWGGQSKSCGKQNIFHAKEYFYKNIKVNNKTGCWLWLHNEHSIYGQISISGINVPVHRFSYEIHKGPIPNNLFICHQCDTPKCVNPYHLKTGTQQDNINNAIKRGRNVKGQKVGTSILTDKQVIEIKSILKNKTSTHEQIAIKFKTSRTAITAISTGQNWSHL
jgi:hypothetical protein